MRRSDYFVNWRPRVQLPRCFGATGGRAAAGDGDEALDLLLDEARFDVEEADGDGDVKIWGLVARLTDAATGVGRR